MLPRQAKEYWEIHERGYNFEYVSAEEQRMLHEFYSWYDWENTNHGSSNRRESKVIQGVYFATGASKLRKHVSNYVCTDVDPALVKDTLMEFSGYVFDDKIILSVSLIKFGFRNIHFLLGDGKENEAVRSKGVTEKNEATTFSPIPSVLRLHENKTFDMVALISSVIVLLCTFIMIAISVGSEALILYLSEEEQTKSYTAMLRQSFVSLNDINIIEASGSLRYVLSHLSSGLNSNIYSSACLAKFQ